MANIMEFVTKTTVGITSSQQQFHFDNNGGSPSNVVMNVLSSIARTNLELDIVQRGGNFIHGNAAGSSSALPGHSSGASSSLSKTKFCFAPLMHVLSIHMKVIAPRVMFQGWGMLTGQWYAHEPPTSSKANEIPLLMQDPLTLLIHYVLLLPFNVDIGKNPYCLCLEHIFIFLTFFQLTF